MDNYEFLCFLREEFELSSCYSVHRITFFPSCRYANIILQPLDCATEYYYVLLFEDMKLCRGDIDVGELTRFQPNATASEVMLYIHNDIFKNWIKPEKADWQREGF